MGLRDEPELPALEKMPAPRAPKAPGWGKRALAAVAGSTFVLSSLAGAVRSLAAGASRFGSFRAFALLLPAILLFRYAMTGRMRA